MINAGNYSGLQPRVITEIRTQIGYLQLLEYTLQDCSYLHVVQYHFNNILKEDNLLPNIHNKSFYREKDKAIEFVKEIGNNLLQQ